MITKILIEDRRFELDKGAGSDSVHTNPVYSYAVTKLLDDSGYTGVGFAFTLGTGNELVCSAAKYYAEKLVGVDIEELMSDFGSTFNALANDQYYRWLGPHKGVVHLALASVTNACFDLWAKKRGVPLWKLLIELSPEQLVNTLDFSYIEDLLSKEEAIQLLKGQQSNRALRMPIIDSGYPGYDTSAGWFNYADAEIRINSRKAVDNGFSAIKLKVGSADPERDIRRSALVREEVGANIKIMLDANQKWSLSEAISIGKRLKDINPFWIEEPTHPDDIYAHKIISDAINPVKLAIGEHVPNRILFKNYLQMGGIGFIQVDAVRVGGVSEFLTISLMCKKFGIPVVPHVGDMGQLHQHLVLYNRIGMGHEVVFLEHIPHLKSKFLHPVKLVNGVYQSPQEPGAGSDLK